MRRSTLIAALCLLFILAGQVRAASPVGDRAFKSGPIQITADGRWVWVVNAHSPMVYRIDTRDQSVKAFPLPYPITDSPRGVSVLEDGSEVWVASHDTDRVYVLDGVTGAMKATIELPWGSGPYSVALSRPDTMTGKQKWALVTLHRSNALAIIDTASRAVIPLGGVFVTPHGIVWTEDGTSAWVNHLLVTDEHPQLARVDISGPVPKVTTRVGGFAASPQNNPQLTNADPAKNVAEGGYLNFRGHPAQIPASTGLQQLWLPTQYHNMHADGFTPDSTVQVSLRRLDLATRKVMATDKVVLTAVSVHNPGQGHNNPTWLGWGWDASISGAVDIGFARLGGKIHAAVLAEQSNELVVLPWDIAPFRSATDRNAPKLPELRVGDRPMGVAISPTEPVAYVYNDLSMNVSIVDLSDPAHPRELGRPDTPLPRGLERYPIVNPVRLRGAKLFYTSADPRVSGNEKVACASCHLNGESDGRAWGMHKTAAGTGGQRHGPRVTQDLLGLGRTFTSGQRSAQFGWGLLHASGDRDEVQDFEWTFRGSQMGGTGFLGDQAQPELGPPNAGRNTDLDALANYVMAVPPLDRSPRRAADGSLTEAAIRGATFFNGSPHVKPADAACASCHVPATAFQDYSFHDVGARRPGEELELNDATKRGECLWCTGTPSLVGAFARPHLTSAYQWATDIVGLLDDFAEAGRPKPHGQIGDLTLRQRLDLAEFVLSIDGQLSGASVPPLRDSAPPRIERIAPTSRSRIEVWFNETVDAATAGNPANYQIVALPSGVRQPVTAAKFDAQNGDRVTLTTALAASAAGLRYRLEPAGPIRDAADSASGGTANVIDQGDARNTHDFTLGDRLTITLGSSGYENLTVPVLDASPIGPGLSNWGNDSAWVYRTEGGQNPGLVRFEWQQAFQAATGITLEDDLLEASFSMLPRDGDAQAIEIRRVLQGWNDPAGRNDYNQNPTGGPTWNNHRHPNQPWNKAGAQALGSRGDRVADYDGTNDLAERVDALVTLPAINERVSFGGPLVSEAFRFWLTHRAQDYGYALRLVGSPGAAPSVIFHGADNDLRQKGPVLSLTYRLADGAAPTPGPTVTPGDERTATPTRTREPEVTATPTRRPCGDDCTATPTRTREPEITATPTRRGCGDDCTATPTPTDRPDRPDDVQLFFPWSGRNVQRLAGRNTPGSWSGSGTGGLQYIQFFVSADGKQVCTLSARATGCGTFFLDPCVSIVAGSFTTTDATGRILRGQFTSASTAEGTWEVPSCQASGRWIADGP
jgi:DNA-binding beta-propeller fold protein YncE